MGEADSVFARRVRLYGLLARGVTGDAVIRELLPVGGPHLYERDLWDYKLESPTPPAGAFPSQDAKQAYALQMAEYVKDAVSFYNSYGGYILFGVNDKPREVEGFQGSFDCDELNKKIAGATKHQVGSCFFVSVVDTSQGPKRLGLLFIPQRPDGVAAAQFLADAPESATGKCAYRKDQIYLREGDQCRPAQSSQDYSFLYGQGRRRFLDHPEMSSASLLENNLGPNDSSFPRFIGRDEYLRQLWRWFFDRFNPVKILAGLGGVGKTSISREFAEIIASNPPNGLRKVIWLSAKQQYYAAIQGQYLPASRVDFASVDELLRTLLSELGVPEKQIPADWSRDELIEQVISHLREFPALVVVDDLDSLEPEFQQEAFHTLIQIIGQTIDGSSRSSRALLTARLDLGAGPKQLIRVKGLDTLEFMEFVHMAAASIELPWKHDDKSRLMKRFHTVTEGSPIFAASILRLVSLGEQLDTALTNWSGSDGEEVRRAAFERELRTLTDSQVRTLYAASVLGETSLVELKDITQSNEVRLRDDIAELRKFHLLSHGSAETGGAMLVVPGTIRLMRDVLRKRLADPKSIEGKCIRARKGAERLTSDLGSHVTRLNAFWLEDRPQEALDLALWLDKKYSKDPDVKCLLGRALLKVTPPRAAEADRELRFSSELKCSRNELVSLRVDAKVLLEDWVGILEITQSADLRPSEALMHRAVAYRKLAEHALRSGDTATAAGHFRDAGQEIDKAFRQNTAGGHVLELRDLRSIFFESYVELVDRAVAASRGYIDTWLATVECFDAYVRRPFIIRLGLQRLKEWWRSVERESRLDEKAARLLSFHLSKLHRMRDTLNKQTAPDTALLEMMAETARALEDRLRAYEARE